MIVRGVPQLFLDDELVAHKQNVSRTWHGLRKHPANPLLTRSDPEERMYLFGTVRREAEPGGEADPVFRMWYFAAGGGRPWVAYARSRDGLQWERPTFGLVEIEGSKDNNALFRPEGWRLLGVSVIRDPNPQAPEAERYKLVCPAEGPDGKRYITGVSPDGLHWEFQTAVKPGPELKADRQCLVWDPFRKLYALYCRARYNPPSLVARGGPAYWGRAVALMTSRDFREWSEPKLVMHANESDPDGTELYGLSAFPCGGQWVALVQIHRSLPSLAYIDVGIAHSRDGERWDREKELVLPRGGVGEWDRFNQCASINPLVLGDEVWVYYSGRTYRHGEYKRHPVYRPEVPRTDSGPNAGWVGLATLRLDGWCSLEADFGGGTVETKPVVLPEGELWLNAKCDWGEVVLEVLEESGEGEPLLRSEPTCGDGVRLKVKWAGGGSIAGLAGRPVRLRFNLKNSLLYSWKVE